MRIKRFARWFDLTGMYILRDLVILAWVIMGTIILVSKVWSIVTKSPLVITH